MAQAQILATVASISGEAFARDNEGKMRRLKAGDTIREGETVVAGDGSQVVLVLADGREMTLLPGQLAKLDAEVAAQIKPDAADSAVVNDPKSFQQIAKALASGSDLDALLEDPAAGVAGAAGNEGHSFVEFARIAETVGSQSYQFDSGTTQAPVITTNNVILDQEDVATPEVIQENRAPTLTVTLTNNFTENSGTAVGAVVASYTTADADGDTVTVTLSDTTNYALDGNGNVTLTADGLALVNSGADLPAFTLTPNDGTVNGAVATVDPLVTPVNDAPVAVAVAGSGAEDAASISIALSATDLDGTIASYTISSLPANGTLYADAGLTTLVAAGATVSGATLYFVPNANWNGSTGFNYSATDNEGLVSNSAAATLTVTPVNEAPVNSLPNSYTTNEDTPIKLSGLSVADVDAGSGMITVTLSVDSGILTAITAGGVTVTGSGTNSLILSGSLSDLNTYLATVADQPSYVPATNASGTVLLTMATNDGGNSGAGGPLNDVDFINIAITPVADPISNSADASVVIGAPIINTINVSQDSGSSYLNNLTSYTFGNGVTMESESGVPFSWSKGSLLGVSSGGGDNRINGSDSINFNFPSGMQYMSLKLKNADNDTVKLSSTLETGDLGSTGTLTGQITSSSGLSISSSNLDVKLNLSFTDGTTHTFSATVVGPNGTWSVAYNTSTKTVATATLVALVDGDLFNQGGNTSANVTYSVSTDMASFAIAQDTANTYSAGQVNDGFQIDTIGFNSGQAGTEYSYPVDVYAAVYDTVGTPETISTLKLSDLPSGSTLSMLQADGTYVEIVPVDGIFDLSAYTSLLTSSTAISGTDKLYLTTTSALPAGFAPTMTLETTDAGSTALTIRGGSASSSHVGSAGNDYINGGAGEDVLTGGTGNDLLAGGTGSDTFVWHLADQGVAGSPAKDTISDFDIAPKTSGGDALDLRDLLPNGATDAGALDGYLNFTKSGSDTVIDIRPDGSTGEVTQQIVLSNVDLTATSSLTDQAIIQSLLNNGKLLTD